MVTNKVTLLGQPTWLHKPFSMRQKSRLDHLIDSLLTQHRPKTITKCDTGDTLSPILSEQQASIITRDSEVHTTMKSGSENSVEVMIDTLGRIQRGDYATISEGREMCATAISYAELLLSKPSTSFNVALQCTFAMYLISTYTPCALQKHKAKESFHFWHRSLTIQGFQM